MKKARKILGKVLLSLGLILVLIFTGAGAFWGYTSFVPMKITVNPADVRQTVDGFGCSTCWWGQIAGKSTEAEKVADALFGDDGLRLNIFRYNVGGGSADNPENRIGVPWRTTESFYCYNENTKQYEYDFSRDAAAQHFLDLALQTGNVDTVVLFANSPHYSMTASGQAAGGLQKAQSNLPRENYKAYVDYFLTITEYFLDKGVPVKYISPLNEPQWDWGGDWVGQEGCHYETEEIVELFELFAREIEARNLPVKLSGPESGEIGEKTEEYFNALMGNEVVRRNLAALSYHSYWTDDRIGRKRDFAKWYRETLADMPLEMSEWCELPCRNATDSIYGTLRQARIISQDMTVSGVNSWTAWTGVNTDGFGEDGKNYSDGLLTADEAFTRAEKTMRYYALWHYSRFIPKGSVCIGCDKSYSDLRVGISDDNRLWLYYTVSASAYQAPNGDIVMVLVNEGGERTVRPEADGTNMTVYTTTQGAQAQRTYSGAVTDTLLLPADSVTTIVFEK